MAKQTIWRFEYQLQDGTIQGQVPAEDWFGARKAASREITEKFHIYEVALQRLYLHQTAFPFPPNEPDKKKPSSSPTSKPRRATRSRGKSTATKERKTGAR